MPLMSALFVTDVNVITNCPLAFADAVSCWMLAMFSSRAVAKRARFQRHRIEYEKVASSHEQRKNPKPRCLVTYSFQLFCRWMFRPGSFCSNFSQFAKELS